MGPPFLPCDAREKRYVPPKAKHCFAEAGRSEVKGVQEPLHRARGACQVIFRGVEEGALQPLDPLPLATLGRG